MACKPQRLYSFAEAVGADGMPLRDAGRPSQTVSWGGSTVLCTRNVRFELADHANCAAKGLTAAGFGAVDLASRGATVRFK